jgi:large subunit ribosomal protein L5
MNRMKEQYQNEMVPVLMKELSLDNVMQVPRLKKVMVNIGMGEAMDNPKALDAAVSDVIQITGKSR